MNYDEFNQFCRALPSATYVMQWGDSHVWKIGGKVFAIGGWGKNKKSAFTFKTSDMNFDFLREHEGYIPAPYFASRGMKWIQQVDTAGDLDEELKYYLSESYRMVSQSLPKRVQAELGIAPKAQ